MALPTGVQISSSTSTTKKRQATTFVLGVEVEERKKDGIWGLDAGAQQVSMVMVTTPL